MVLSHLVIRSEKDQIRSLCHTKRENTFKMGLKTNIHEVERLLKTDELSALVLALQMLSPKFDMML